MILDFYVDTTEQVVCGSNTYKVMYLNTVVEDTIPNYGSLVWVEKIGSIGGGIINSHMMIDMIFKNLYCMQHNDTVYNVSSYSYPPNLLTCDLGECIDPVGIGKPKHDDIEINIFPNPTSNKIYLDFGNYGDFTEIKIINSQGITMINNNLRGIRYNYSIDLKDLPVGIYTYIITTSQKKVLSGKVIVK